MQSWAIDMLLDWSRNDPVSQKELDRNDAVYAIQGNRNPFVDDPELIEYIWGDRQGDQYTVEHYEGDPVLISPVQDSDISFGEVAIGRSQSVDVNVRGAGLTGSITVQLYNRENPGDAKKIPAMPKCSVLPPHRFPHQAPTTIQGLRCV